VSSVTDMRSIFSGATALSQCIPWHEDFRSSCQVDGLRGEMSFLGVDVDTANANKPAFDTTIAGIAGVDETSIVALSFAPSSSYSSEGVTQCFLDGGDCASCCPDCDVTTSRDSSAADQCVCYEAVAEYDYTGITLSDYDDCLHIIAPFDDYSVSDIYGGSGDDVIVLEGNDFRGIHGGDGKDKITINGNDASSVRGDSGDDNITITGDYANDIDGGNGDDTITIIGNDAYGVYGGHGDDTIIINGGGSDDVFGGPDHDSCSILGDGAFADCEGVANVDTGVKALYDIKVEDDDEANEISGRITSAEPAAVSVEGLENVTCLSIDAPANYATFA
jgi:hypothetical protein